jgi:hypothetical protein
MQCFLFLRGLRFKANSWFDDATLDVSISQESLVHVDGEVAGGEDLICQSRSSATGSKHKLHQISVYVSFGHYISAREGPSLGSYLGHDSQLTLRHRRPVPTIVMTGSTGSGEE